jgi:hypothetical protein
MIALKKFFQTGIVLFFLLLPGFLLATVQLPSFFSDGRKKHILQTPAAKANGL